MDLNKVAAALESQDTELDELDQMVGHLKIEMESDRIKWNNWAQDVNARQNAIDADFEKRVQAADLAELRLKIEAIQEALPVELKARLASLEQEANFLTEGLTKLAAVEPPTPAIMPKPAYRKSTKQAPARRAKSTK